METNGYKRRNSRIVRTWVLSTGNLGSISVPTLTSCAIQALFLIYEIKRELILLKHVRIKWDDTHKAVHIVPDMLTQ